MEHTSIRVDREVVNQLNAIRDGKPYNQIVRELLGLPEVKQNKPRKKTNRLIRAIRTLVK